MTYSSRTFLISCGLGSLSRARSARSSSSSRMMSLHSSTHSSQTNTEGPAISFRTSCWLFPQNEQYNSLPSSCLPRESSLMLSSSSPYPQYSREAQLDTDYIAPGRPRAKERKYRTVTRVLVGTMRRCVGAGLPLREARARPLTLYARPLTLYRQLTAFLQHGIDQPVRHGR